MGSQFPFKPVLLLESSRYPYAIHISKLNFLAYRYLLFGLHFLFFGNNKCWVSLGMPPNPLVALFQSEFELCSLSMLHRFKILESFDVMCVYILNKLKYIFIHRQVIPYKFLCRELGGQVSSYCRLFHVCTSY